MFCQGLEGHELVYIVSQYPNYTKRNFELLIVSPFDGWVRPLKHTSDAVFAQELLGKGVAIEPMAGDLFSPCEGLVANIGASLHSIVLKTSSGNEFLIHIGIDTVALKGRGFKVHVKEGDTVKAGDKLISFDLDLVAEAAPSLLTPIIVLDPEAIIDVDCENQFVRVGDPLFEVLNFFDPISKQDILPSQQHKTASRKLILELGHGIHARPAGRISQLVKQSNSEIIIKLGSQSVNANSVVALMKLNAKNGDEIEIIAKGQDADIAVESLVTLLSTELKLAETLHFENNSSNNKPTAAPSAARASNNFYGVVASGGFAFGKTVIYAHEHEAFEEKGLGAKEEKVKLLAALEQVSISLKENSKRLGGHAKNIALAHIEILQDPELCEAAYNFLDEGFSAPAAWQKSSRAQEDILKQSENLRIQERAADLRDIELQIINALCGVVDGIQHPADNKEIILIADDLLPSQFLALKHENVKAICTRYGGATAHVGILAASFGIPMIVALGENLTAIANDQTIIVDAHDGFINPNPSKSEITAAQKKIKAALEKSEREASLAKKDCVMADGTRIEVFANLASKQEAEKALQMGAEGCGLLRTEFLFMERKSAPSEAEQTETLSHIASALQGKPIIVRTLDIGGDKPISYIPFPFEENPALGVRGVRHSLANIELFETQIRSIIGGIDAGQFRIMLPMIIDLEEFRAARRIIDKVALECEVKSPIQVGVMVETPSAAIMADNLAKEADFLSIGSNDLTQYTLAMDRGNSELAARADCLHPAVLNMIAIAAKGAKANGKWIGVCGGIAAMPHAVPILLGLGITELSVPVSSIQQIKARVSELKMTDCEVIARSALLAVSAAEVKDILKGKKNEAV